MIQFTPVSQAHVLQLLAELEKNNATITNNAPNRYHIDSLGVIATAEYSPDRQQLNVTVIKKPTFVSESFIRDGLAANLNRILKDESEKRTQPNDTNPKDS